MKNQKNNRSRFGITGVLKGLFDRKGTRAIRKGLIFMTPLAIISSFVLVLLNFPIASYQEWMASQDAFLVRETLNLVYSGTINYFSIILSFAISWCYAEELEIKNGKSFVVFGSIAAFFVLVDVTGKDFMTAYFGTAGIVSAFAASIFTVWVFYRIKLWRIGRKKETDTDTILAKMSASIVPLGAILLFLATCTRVLEEVTGHCFQGNINMIFSRLFYTFESDKLLMGIIYILSMHMMWWVGIHGSHVYFEINDVYLLGLVQNNLHAVEAGKEPVEIINKVFLDSAVNIGGAGATLALVIAILLVSRNKNMRKVAGYGIIPSVFNINEIILFGIPIVFNTTLLIPFLLVPLLNLLLAYLATAVGIMPVVIRQIDWITPPILSGYLMTRSINGALVQMCLIVLDILIYIPFVKKMDRKEDIGEELYEDDIERIKTMEEKNQENRRLIRSLTNIFGDVYEADVTAQTVHLVHSKFKNSYFGYGEEIPFKEFEEYFTKYMNDEKKEEMKSFLSDPGIQKQLIEKGTTEFEFPFMINGEQHWYRLKIILSEEKDGKPAILTITIVNIDSYKKRWQENNDALRMAYYTAQQASRAKSDFLANMSHDIRTPMNAIIGMGKIARDNIDDKEKVKECLQKIDSSSAHLLDLINAVLDMSKIESGKFILVNEPFDVESLPGMIADIIKPQARKKGIVFEEDYQWKEHLMVLGDAVRIRQVLINILGNSIKFTPEGGNILFSMKISEGQYKDYVTVEFVCRDTGSGMSEEAKEKLFEPFERADSAESGRIEGNGLGMALVKNIVDIMQGEIYVNSTLGEGTEIRTILHLKKWRAAEEETEETNETKEIPDPEGMLRGKRILLVEDNDLNREIASAFLEILKPEIEEACDGQEAVDKFEASPEGYYSMILMDIQMPGMDGYEASRTIREMGRTDSDLPIIALTANAFSDDVNKAHDAGMNAHIAKPIDADKMIEVLASFRQ